MFDPPDWGIGVCDGCKRKRDLRRGRCIACRHPVQQRPLIEAGIPCSTAGVLANLANKCASPSEATKLLGTVHPILMENLEVDRGMKFKVLHEEYRWRRRNGWHKK
jgi:hypothetical protein